MNGHNESVLARELAVRCPKCGGPSIPHYNEKCELTGKRVCLALLTCPVVTFEVLPSKPFRTFAEMHEDYLDQRVNG